MWQQYICNKQANSRKLENRVHSVQDHFGVWHHHLIHCECVSPHVVLVVTDGELVTVEVKLRAPLTVVNGQNACEARTDKHLPSSRHRPVDAQRIEGKELSIANQLIAIVPLVEPIREEVRV